jgi:hypothetical protein
MAKGNQKQFPPKLFVYRDEDGDDVYYIANETERECASLGESRLVGIYELKEVGKILVNIVQVAA